jgi:hypothetical protein
MAIRNLTTGAWLFNHTVRKIGLRCFTELYISFLCIFTIRTVLCPTEQSVFTFLTLLDLMFTEDHFSPLKFMTLILRYIQNKYLQ